MRDLDQMRHLRDKACIVGAGETGYRADAEAFRQGKTMTDSYGYAARSFTSALDDSGVKKEAIDGVIVGGPISTSRTCEILGLNPRWTASESAGGAIILASLWIASGLANTVALIYGNNQRSGGTQYAALARWAGASVSRMSTTRPGA